MRKAIILLLVVSMLSLASCSNKSVETNTSTNESNTSSVVSADVSSVVSEDISSELASGEGSVSSVASENTKATKNKNTSNKNALNALSTEDKIKRVYSDSFFKIATVVAPEKSKIENNPAIINTADFYFEYADSKIEKTMVGTMNKAEFNKHKDKIAFYLKDTIMYANYDAWEKTNKNADEMMYFYYLGKVDEYNLFAIDFVNGDMLMDEEFNRLAGYQFLSSPYISRPSFDDEPDKYGNLKTNVKNKLEYSGIVLEKGGKYYTMEDLYIDNVISAETVGKIYNALPKRMQMGVFNDYKDAYKVSAYKINVGDWIGANNVMFGKKTRSDFISYYDKDGKFHVVYADD